LECKSQHQPRRETGAIFIPKIREETQMQRQFTNDYYYGSESEQYTFYRLPKVLFTDERFKKLSDSAKILYGLMLDRMGLSQRNGWLDERNRVYIYFTLEDVQKYLNCKTDKGIKLLAELDTVKGVGLIERKKQGQGKPTKIYLKKFVTGGEFQNSEKPKPEPFDYSTDTVTIDDANPEEIQTSENPSSAITDFARSATPVERSLQSEKTECNNTKINNTEFSETQSNQSNLTRASPADRIDTIDEIDIYREIIKDNIEYDYLAEHNPYRNIDGLVEIMTEAVTTTKEYLCVGGEQKRSVIVKSRLLKLNQTHIEYVLECLDNNTSKIYNIRAYLLTSLYNAPNTIDSYYTAEVNHDMYGGTQLNANNYQKKGNSQCQTIAKSWR
jgi:hypothetical protein